MFKLTVAEAKNVSLDIPKEVAQAAQAEKSKQTALTDVKKSLPVCEKVLRTLTIRQFRVKKVFLKDTTSIENDVLYIDKKIEERALKQNNLVKKVKIDIIEPHQRHIYTNTVMDFIPIAVKVEGKLGEGVTHYLKGVVAMLTGTDENGKQISEFGSSEGFLDETVQFDRPGTPETDDIILRIDVVIQKGTGMERRGPLSAHQVCDYILEQIRNELKKMPGENAVKVDTYQDTRRPGRPRILIVKELGGEGAMHDNLLMPAEPGGVRGGKSVIDLGNIPVMLSPNEVKDGGIHSLT